MPFNTKPDPPGSGNPPRVTPPITDEPNTDNSAPATPPAPKPPPIQWDKVNVLFVGVPSLLCSVLFVAGQITNINALWWSIIGVALMTPFIGWIMSFWDVWRIQHQQVKESLTALPLTFILKVYNIVLLALVLGLYVPFHTLPSRESKAIILLLLAFVGGLAYDLALKRSGPDIMPAMKWGSLVVLVVLLIIHIFFGHLLT